MALLRPVFTHKEQSWKQGIKAALDTFCTCSSVNEIIPDPTVSNLCPADDLSVGFELRAVEYLDAGDGLHRLPIDGTDDAESTQTFC